MHVQELAMVSMVFTDADNITVIKSVCSILGLISDIFGALLLAKGFMSKKLETLKNESIPLIGIIYCWL